jgi:hypothetical protein
MIAIASYEAVLVTTGAPGTISLARRTAALDVPDARAAT